MTDLSFLYDAIAGRTKGPWKRSSDSANFVTSPTRDICACIVYGDEGKLAGQQECRPNADFIALMGTVADELAAVLRAAEDVLEEEIYAKQRPTSRAKGLLYDALAALAAACNTSGGEE